MEENLHLADYTILPINIKLIIIGQSRYKKEIYSAQPNNYNLGHPRQFFGRFRGDSDRRPYLIFIPIGINFCLHFGKGIRNYHYLRIWPYRLKCIHTVSKLSKRGNWEIELCDMTFKYRYLECKKLFDLKNVKITISFMEWRKFDIEMLPSNVRCKITCNKMSDIHEAYIDFIYEAEIYSDNVDDIIEKLRKFKNLRYILMSQLRFNKYKDKIESSSFLKGVKVILT